MPFDFDDEISRAVGYFVFSKYLWVIRK